VARSSNRCCRGKSLKVLHILSVCFVALGTQHAMRMRHIIPPPVACSALQYFSTLSHFGTIFEENKLLKTKCVFELSTTFVSNVIIIIIIIIIII
jgi:hypothetical protein